MCGPEPLLYGFIRPDGRMAYAYRSDLLAATPDEITAYRDEATHWAEVHGTHR